MLADGDAEADTHRAAHGDHGVGIEARVGPHGELAARACRSDAADRLSQEVGGPPNGIGTAATQPRREDVARAGRDREQRVIAADMAVREVGAAFLSETVRLADGRVQIDRERLRSGSRTGGPGPGEQLAADAVELANVAPAEAAQERAEGGRRLDGEAQHPARATGAQGVRVIDAVAAREGGHDERQELVAWVRPAGRRTEIEVPLNELPQTELRGQGGRQEQARVGHQAVVVEAHTEPVEAVR